MSFQSSRHSPLHSPLITYMTHMPASHSETNPCLFSHPQSSSGGPPHSLQPPQLNWVSPSSEKACNCGHLCSYRPASLDQVSIPHSLYSDSQTPKIPSLICHPPWKGIFHEIKKKNPVSDHWWIPRTLEPKRVGIIHEGKAGEKEKWRKGGMNRGSYLHPTFSPNYKRNTEHSSPERDILSQ